jgi:hypothetical protein
MLFRTHALLNLALENLRMPLWLSFSKVLLPTSKKVITSQCLKLNPLDQQDLILARVIKNIYKFRIFLKQKA